MSGRDRALFSLLFFLSGLAGLIYEVCWTRLLRLPMGNTVASLTTVLAAFMGGLALGAWIAGRRLARASRPLRVYAGLEAAIGLACLLLPFVVAGQQPFFRWVYRSFGDNLVFFHALRFLACSSVILVPATLMGATLPVLCRAFFDRPDRIGRSIGWLYAVNAAGAVAGSLLAGFAFLPNIGQRASIGVGVAISFTVAVIAWRASRRAPARLHAAAAPDEASPQVRPLRSKRGDASRARALVPAEGSLRLALLVGYALSGAAAMVLQIAWTRVLALALGSSVYAFAVLVSAFILGLAIGSAIASRVVDRLTSPALGFAFVELGIGFTAVAMVPVWQHFPDWMMTIVPRWAADFSKLQLVQFGLVFGVLLLPTIGMGACLPLVGRAIARDVDRAAESVGAAYSANAVGTIAGALLGGFVVLPWLGMHRAILTGAGLDVAVGCVILAWVRPQPRAAIGATAAVAAAAACFALLPPLDPTVFTSGVYLYADRLLKDAPRAGLRNALRADNHIVLNTEGTVATITVKDGTNGIRSLYVNGKADASDDLDMVTQQLLGDLPMLLHEAPRDVAVVGLASGVSAHAVAQFPTVRRIECIEIAPEMPAACRLFDHVNGRVLDDPRVHVVIQDGRNHLMLTDHQYDVIVSEPSNPWIAGIASLFTREFFQACSDRLRPGGIACVWVQSYGLDLHALQSVVRTFQDVFPNAILWESIFASDYQLIGAQGPISVSYDALAARMRQAEVAADLARVSVKTPADLLVHYVAGGAALRQFAASGEIYRDDRNRLEFEAPRLLHSPTALTTLAALQSLRRPGLPEWMPPGAGTAAAEEQVAAAQAAQTEFWRGVLKQHDADDAGAMLHFVQALEKNRNLLDAWPRLLETSRSTLRRAVAGGDSTTAMAMHRRMLALDPPLADFYNDYAVLLGSAHRIVEAEAVCRRAVAVRPHAVPPRLNLATALVLAGKTDEAEAVLRDILNDRPDQLRARVMLGNLLLQNGDAAGAESEYRTAVRIEPAAVPAWLALGETLRRRGDVREAARAYETALRHDATLAGANRALADCYRRLGDEKKAAAALTRAAAAR